MEIQKKTLADVLLAEVHPAWSRENGTLADQSGADVPLGTVLARVAGKYLPVDFAGEDGSQNAVAVLAEEKLAVADDVPAVVLRRGVVVNTAGLVWPTGATTEQKTAAIAALDALGIAARAAL